MSAADTALLDDLATALHEERRRGPSDLLAILTILLLGSAAILLALAVVMGTGVAGDLLLNLTGELVGAALTVVLIGGLWTRFEASSSRAMDDLSGSWTSAGPLACRTRTGSPSRRSSISIGARRRPGS